MSGRDNFVRDVPWTRQPQGAVGINRALFPDPTKISVFFCPVLSGSTDFVTGKAFGVSPTTVTAGGAGWRMTGFLDFVQLASNSDNIFDNNNATILCFQTRLETTTGAAANGYIDAGGARVDVNFPFSDGNVYWSYGNSTVGSGRVATSGIAPAIGVPEAWAFVAGSRGREIWRNGVRVANNTGATATRAATSTPFYLGATAGAAGSVATSSASTRHDYYFFIILKEQWSAAKLSEWGKNPWSVFAPRQRRIFVSSPAAAGGGFFPRPQPWRKQPQQPVRLNRANPLALMLDAANLPVSTSPVNVVNGRQEFVQTATVSAGVGPGGKSTRGDGVSGYLERTVSIPDNVPLIMLVYFTCRVRSATSKTLYMLGGSANNTFAYVESGAFGGADLGFYMRRLGSGSAIGVNIGNVSTIPFVGETYAVAVHVPTVNASEAYCYINGRRYAFDTGTTLDSSGSTLTREVISGFHRDGAPANYSSDDIYFTGYGVGAKVAKGGIEALLREWTLNPWSIFAPIPTRVFTSGTTGGGSYTLTLSAIASNTTRYALGLLRSAGLAVINATTTQYPLATARSLATTAVTSTTTRFALAIQRALALAQIATTATARTITTGSGAGAFELVKIATTATARTLNLAASLTLTKANSAATGASLAFQRTLRLFANDTVNFTGLLNATRSLLLSATTSVASGRPLQGVGNVVIETLDKWWGLVRKLARNVTNAISRSTEG